MAKKNFFPGKLGRIFRSENAVPTSSEAESPASLPGKISEHLVAARTPKKSILRSKRPSPAKTQIDGEDTHRDTHTPLEPARTKQTTQTDKSDTCSNTLKNHQLTLPTTDSYWTSPKKCPSIHTPSQVPTNQLLPLTWHQKTTGREGKVPHPPFTSLSNQSFRWACIFLAFHWYSQKVVLYYYWVLKIYL